MQIDMQYFELAGVIISALATVILAFLTGRYVKLTHFMLEETKASKDPSVFIDIEPTGNSVNFLVGNTGSTPANNIKINIAENITWKTIQNYPSGLSSLEVIQQGISYLAPKRTLKFRAGVPDWNTLTPENGEINFKYTFENETEKKFQREFTINLFQYLGVSLESFSSPISGVEKAIKNLERSSSSKSSLSQAFRRLNSKSCPICGEQITFTAKKCPHCHEMLPNQENT